MVILKPVCQRNWEPWASTHTPIRPTQQHAC